MIRDTAKAAGIKKEISSHTYRRSRATHLLDDGLPLEQVSRLLRHKHISSTMTYLKISIKGLQTAINKIDRNNI
jgi:integrase/recombinase XerD